jgi:hypothetical protein
MGSWRMDMRGGEMRRTLVIVMAVLMVTVGTGYAGSVGTLTTFTPNTPAHAESVNDNFTAVETAVNDNVTDITTNADGISSNADSITDVKNQLGNKLDKPTCTDGQVLKYSSGVWVCAEDIDTVNTDADTLDGLDSTDFADSSHVHSWSPTGIHWIRSPECDGQNILLRSTIAIDPGVVVFPTSVYCPISIPFKCTITEVQFKARDSSDISDMVFEIHDGLFDAGLDENVPLASTDTSGWTSTGPISFPYDPTNFDYDQPWWIRIYFNAVVPDQRVRWIRIYYTIP